jgi:ankyrin repeat protein
VPWGLIGALVLLAGTTLYLLLPDYWDRPRRAGLSADSSLDALVYEIHWGEFSQVRRAVRRVRNVNEHDVTGTSPLGHAAMTSRRDGADVCRLLLDHGADPHVRDRAGNTPLIIAACMNHELVAAELLRAGAHPDARNDRGVAALHTAADHPEALEIVRMLLAAGADPRVRDRDGKTPRDYAGEAENAQHIAVLESFARGNRAP